MTLDLDALDPRLPRVESALHGPAHPDEFRVKVGRFGERFYHDPLPACDLAEACTDAWPSVTTIKKAADRDWSWVSLERGAQYLAERLHELDGMNKEEIHARLLEVNKAGLNRAANRGTSIHHVMEALAAGGTLPPLSPEAEPYLPACRKFLEEAQPEWLLSEVVSISRSHAYGGTFDAVVRIDGGTYLVDWKTRKPGKHGAYPEEAYQLAAYAFADYIIVDHDGTAVRQKMPPLDGAFVISLAPEGYRPYPVDLDEGWRSFTTLREFWDRKRVDHIGKPVRFSHAAKPARRAKATKPEPTPIGNVMTRVFLRAWINRRLQVLRRPEHAEAARLMAREWPEGVPGLKTDHEHTEAELNQIASVIDRIEARFGIPFGDTDPRAPKPAPTPQPEMPAPMAPPDEGPDMERQDVDAILRRINDQPLQVRELLNSWAAEAHSAGKAFSIRLRPGRRRWEIYRACLELVGLEDADMVRATIALVIPDAAQPAIPIGAAIGSLTIDEAVRLGEMAKAIKTSTPALSYDDDGTVHWADFDARKIARRLAG